MHVRRDPRFDDEAARHALVFNCEDCGNFDRRADTCAHEWPTAQHRRERYRRPSTELVFCKEFEAA